MDHKTLTLKSRLRDLGLALLNATLLLTVLCLALVYATVARFDGALDDFGESLASLRPAQGELQNLKQAVTGLQDELRNLRQQDKGSSTKFSNDLEEQFGRLIALENRIDKLSRRPQELINTSIEMAAASFGSALSQATGCKAYDPPPDGS